MRADLCILQVRTVDIMMLMTHSTIYKNWEHVDGQRASCRTRDGRIRYVKNDVSERLFSNLMKIQKFPYKYSRAIIYNTCHIVFNFLLERASLQREYDTFIHSTLS